MEQVMREAIIVMKGEGDYSAEPPPSMGRILPSAS